jgi:hypothetical protein
MNNIFTIGKTDNTYFFNGAVIPHTTFKRITKQLTIKNTKIILTQRLQGSTTFVFKLTKGYLKV